jgi:acyl carrier protein
MSKVEIETVVRDIVTEQLGHGSLSLRADKPLSDYYADSLDMVEITLAIEEKFGIEIPDDDAERFHTLHDIYTYLDQRLNGK